MEDYMSNFDRQGLGPSSSLESTNAERAIFQTQHNNWEITNKNGAFNHDLCSEEGELLTELIFYVGWAAL